MSVCCCHGFNTPSLTIWNLTYPPFLPVLALQYLEQLATAKAPLREAWATWNPYREATQRLQQQIMEGTLSLEVRREHKVEYVTHMCHLNCHALWVPPSAMPCGSHPLPCATCSRDKGWWRTKHDVSQCQSVDMFCLLHCIAQDTIRARNELDQKAAASPVPGTLRPEEAKALGWYPHGATFTWPAPKEPGSYGKLPNAPSEARAEELRQPWEEGTLHRPLSLR
jgi:hypothetical protein